MNDGAPRADALVGVAGEDKGGAVRNWLTGGAAPVLPVLCDGGARLLLAEQYFGCPGAACVFYPGFFRW